MKRQNIIKTKIDRFTRLENKTKHDAIFTECIRK